MAKKGIFSSMTATKIKAIILSVVIAIVLAGFVIYLVDSIYPSPKWDDYCEDVKVPRVAVEKEGEIVEVDQVQCEEDGGTWRNGYCDYYYECQQEFEKKDNEHKRVLFIVGAITGLIAIAVGIMLALPSVSSGLMLGGTFLIFFGTSQYWSELSNWIRALILGLALIVLIWLGYKKLKV